jgi:Na+-translocating ferredoxin:NAD+ oxidoreductase RnfA subunit
MIKFLIICPVLFIILIAKTSVGLGVLPVSFVLTISTIFAIYVVNIVNNYNEEILPIL